MFCFVVRTGSGVKVDPIGMKLTQLDGMIPFTVGQDLMRTLAQVHLINAEVMHLIMLRGEEGWFGTSLDENTRSSFISSAER